MHGQRSRTRSLRTLTRSCFATIALAAACQNPEETTAPTAPGSQAHASSGHSDERGQAGEPGRAVQRQIARLRTLTAPFHRFDAAVTAGWGTKITDCFSDPQLGGMGYHYGNTAYIDGIVDPLKPELLLYEPGKKGELRFVAVEYIVPFDAWTEEEPPTLYGQVFHRNEAFGIWALHVWHVRHNPRGMFADWNPKVSCRYAAP